MNPDKLAGFLKKPRQEFTKEDIIKFIKGNGIRMLNFNYTAGDGRLKTLSFSINDEMHLRELLECGERVDGSSLFSYVDPSNSDMYVIPKFRTAFLNPFTPLPTLNILCSYFDANGREVNIAPEYIVKKAHETLRKRTGISLNALGELEYYIVFRKEEDWFPGTPQRSYHESSPFVKFEPMRDEILHTLSSIGIRVKYGHTEVGNIILKDGRRFEQYEIELLPEPLEDMADHIVVAKWVIRNIAAKYGVGATFAPKLAMEHAGTGLHIHIEPIRKGKNITLDKNGNLSKQAKKIIGGLLELSPSLTAFGNTNPTSYLRLVPDKEAPTYICWGDRNRSALIRVPLGWRMKHSMSKRVNKYEKGKFSSCQGKQTIEFRAPDGSANIHLLLAGIAVAARYGLLSDKSLKITRDAYIDVNIFKERNQEIINRLKHLPTSCVDSAEKIRKQKSIYLENAVFSKRVIDGIIEQLENFNDKNLRSNKKKAKEYIRKFFNCG